MSLIKQLRLQARKPPWSPCYRLIPSHFPPVHLFESVAGPEDFDALYELESRTNPRLQDQAGRLGLVADEDRIYGPGSSPVMAAFTHPATQDIRFCPAGKGCYYGARTLDTAIVESRHHRERYLRAVNEPAAEVSVRCYIAELVKPLYDGRRALVGTACLDPDDYSASIRLGNELRLAGAWGLVYPSVRDPDGACVAVFRPPAIQVPVRQGPHYRYLWDGERIRHVVKTELID